MRQVHSSGGVPARGALASLRSGALTYLIAIACCAGAVAVLVASRSRDTEVTRSPEAARPPQSRASGTSALPATGTPPPRPATQTAATTTAGGSRRIDSTSSGNGSSPVTAAIQSARVDPKIEQQMKQVLEKTEELDRTVFAREVEAQEYEEYFIELWDAFRAAPLDKLGVLERAAFDTLTFPAAGEAKRHDWDITVTRHDGVAQPLDAAGWRALLGRVRAAGYQATELEFHQSAFTHDEGQPARSTVATLVHLVNPKSNSRQVLRTKLKVEWSDRRAETKRTPGTPTDAKPAAAGDKGGGPSLGAFLPRTIEATELTIADRPGGVAFEPVMLPRSTPNGLWTTEASGFLLAYDLDGDGRSELLVPGENLLLRNRGDWRFEGEQMLGGAAAGRRGATLIADFNGDALPDLLCFDGVVLHVARGVSGGRFSPDAYEPAV